MATLTCGEMDSDGCQYTAVVYAKPLLLQLDAGKSRSLPTATSTTTVAAAAAITTTTDDIPAMYAKIPL